MIENMAFLFPGQGAQYVGMGKSLYENIDECKKIFDMGDEILDMPMKDMIFDGNEEDLKELNILSLQYYLLQLHVLKQ